MRISTPTVPQWRNRLMLWLCGVASFAYAGWHEEAIPILPNSNTVSGVFQTDTEVHLYEFPFAPWTTYTIQVETGSVWGIQMEVIPPVGAPALWSTNSVWQDVAAVTNAYHQGASARWQMRIAPLFAFTTGSYQVVVWEQPGQDSNASGFPDAWELAMFGNLTTAVLAAHAEAFRTGRLPDDPLGVDSLRLEPAGDVVGWSVAAYGTYDLFTSTNLLDTTTWSHIGTHVAGGAGGVLLWTNAPGHDAKRFYHIRFRDE